jgi:Arc/MetJ family transcription regulator
MRTNIILDDQLVKEAFHYTDATTKRELVEIALREFIANHKRRDILELQGKIKINKRYNYKKLREGQ